MSYIPLFKIAVGAGVDRGVGEGLHVAGQDDFLVRRARLRLNHVHGRHGGFVRLLFSAALARMRGTMPAITTHDHDDDGHDQQ